MKISIFKFIFCLFAIALVSCDKDFNTVGSEIIGEGNYQFDKMSLTDVKAFSVATGPVQTNNLPINSLGVYNDPFFGKNISTFVAQLELERIAPDFGITPEIRSTDSVYLYVPYFSTIDAVGTGNVASTFKLNEVYGDLESSFNLKIYESNYFLRSLDAANPSEPQRYFSDQKSLITTVGTPLNINSEASSEQNVEFKFSKNEILRYKRNNNGDFINNAGTVVTNPSDRVVIERIAPGMWINLDKNFFANKIINAPSSSLLNQNNFKEYFKGIYFDVEENAGQNGVLAQLDFSRAEIVIQYHSKATADAEFKKNTFKLNLRGNTVNFFDFTPNSNYSVGLSQSNFNTGDQFLYLKGGNGSMAFIDLFEEVDVINQDLTPGSNGVADELDRLRNDNLLINDAILTFTIDNRGQENAKRIFLFDATNNTVLLDYSEDATTNANSKLNKSIHDGILKSNSSGTNTSYVIRLRNHFNKILNNPNEEVRKNVRLGLVVTDNINISNFGILKNSITSYPNLLPNSGNMVISRIPVANTMHPLGTILYGTNAADAEKRMKFEIYYTKPN